MPVQAEEIESWYQREKERITEEFTMMLRQSQNKDIAKVHAEYEPKFCALIAKYNKLQGDLIIQEARRKRSLKRKKRMMDTIAEIKKKFMKE